MEITTYLAMLWGPVLVAVGLGFFLSTKYYTKIYRDLEKDALVIILFGMAAMGAGIAQVHAHNTWDTLPEILISLLGWALLVKGAFCVVLPRFVERLADWALSVRMVPAAGGLHFIIGAYLTWFAYFA